MNLQLLESMMEHAVDEDEWGHWKTMPYLTDVDPMKSYGFVYVIRNKTNNKLYIGRKNTRHFGKKSSKNYGKETNWKRYAGSSKHVTEDIKIFGKDNFEFILLEFYNTRGGLNYAEIAFQIKCDVMTAKLPDGERQFYNGQVGAVRWIPKETRDFSERTRQLMSEAKKGKPANNPNLCDNLIPGGIDAYAGWNSKRIQINKGDSEIIFNDTKDAAKFVGCAHDSVARVARGEKKTIYGWEAKYL